jgi:integrase/recombinase XerD
LFKGFNRSTRILRLWVREVLGDQYTPHSIRRSHATHMLLKGANPKVVMLQLGHSKVETTFRYLQLSKTKNMKIYDKFY